MLSNNQLNTNTNNSVVDSLDVVIDNNLTDLAELIIDDFLLKNKNASAFKCYTETKSISESKNE